MKADSIKVGDKVESKSHMFWMTVDKITPKGVVCSFGKKGVFAGIYKRSELRKID